jgi:hypothetical protein
MRFKILVQNPHFISTNGGLEISTMLAYSNHAVERFDLVNILKTTPYTFNLANLKTFIGWNVDMSYNLLYTTPIKIIRGDTVKNKRFYNSLKF